MLGLLGECRQTKSCYYVILALKIGKLVDSTSKIAFFCDFEFKIVTNKGNKFELKIKLYPRGIQFLSANLPQPPILPIQRSELDGFGQMNGPNRFRLIQIGHSARYL